MKLNNCYASVKPDTHFCFSRAATTKVATCQFSRTKPKNINLALIKYLIQQDENYAVLKIKCLPRCQAADDMDAS